MCRAGADDGVGALTEDRAIATGGNDDGVRRKGAYFHGAEIHGADAAADAARIEYGGEKFPAFVLLHLAFGFVAANLLIERVEQLLAGGCAGKGSAVEERATEAAKIEQAFGRAIEWHAHAIEQINNRGRSFRHSFDGRLIREKIAAVDRVVKMLPGSIALALEILGRIDAALGADRMGALDRHDRKEVDLSARLRDFDDRGKAGKTSAHYDDPW